jgi:hypothetical protein
MMQRRIAVKFAATMALALPAIVAVNPALAVPSFARQTGQECIACHVSFPELTPYGRYFKLTGYTIGKKFVSSEGCKHLALAFMAQAWGTNNNNNHATDPETGDTVTVNQRNNSAVFSAASVFLASKVNDYVGGFIQWTYNNLATKADGTLGGHSGIDNTDLRAVGKYSGSGAAEPDLIYGLTLNNNPTVQDPWNSTPAFGYPYTASPLAQTPAAATQIDGGLAQQVAGVGGYLWWKKMVYGELSFYRTADGAFSVLRAGQDIHTDGGVAAVQNWNNPYWRFALSHDWGANSVMMGTYGMIVNKYPSNFETSTATERYRDIAVDAQYQSSPIPYVHRAGDLHQREAVVQGELCCRARDRRRHRRRPYTGKSHRHPEDVQAQGHVLPRSEIRRDAGVLFHDGQRRRRPLWHRCRRQCPHARQQGLRHRTRLPADPERPADAPVHRLQQVRRREEQLRRQWP